MPSIKAGNLVQRTTLSAFHRGDGKYLDKNFRLKRMWRLRRILCRIAPRLFLPASTHDTVVQLKKKLADYKIDKVPIGEANAEEILTRSGVARKIGDSLTATTIMDRTQLDRICETSAAVLGKRKRSSSQDNIENRPPAPKRGLVTERQPIPKKQSRTGRPVDWKPLTPQQLNLRAKSTRSRPETPPVVDMEVDPVTTAPPPQIRPVANAVKRKPAPVYHQVEPPSQQTIDYENKIFDQLDNRYCPDQDRFHFLRSFYFSLQDLEPELNDQDFVKLVNKGSFNEIESDLMRSWDYEVYKEEAVELMKSLKKKPQHTITPPEQKPIQPSVKAPSKKIVTYRGWSQKAGSQHALLYVLRNTSKDTRIESHFIENHLTPFIMEKLQADYAVPQAEVKVMANGILGELEIHPGSESTIKYGQIQQLAGRIKRTGARYRAQHPVPEVKEAPLPKVVSQLPQTMQEDPSIAHAYAELNREKLTNSGDFIHFYQQLGKRAVSNDQFRYQLEVFKWLQSSGQFSREDFVKTMQQGLCHSVILDRLLMAKAKDERPADFARQIKNSMYTPPPTATASQQRIQPVNPPLTTMATQNLVSNKRTQATGLPSLNYLMTRRGMPNFSNTCYFNSVCQQLAMAIPAQTLAAVAEKPIQDKYARDIRDAFVPLINLVNTQYTETMTRQQEYERQQQFAQAQANLLHACHAHGQHHPGSKFRMLLPHTDLSQLGQQDASEMFIALTEALKLEEHPECSLQTDEVFVLPQGDKTYTYHRPPLAGEILSRQIIPQDAENGSMNLQACINAQSQPEWISREWSEYEAKQARHPNPQGLAKSGSQTSGTYSGLVSKDISQFRSHSIMLGLSDFYWDKQLQTLVTKKLTSRGRNVGNDSAQRITKKVFDQKTQQVVEVPMELASVVVHQGGSLNSGHYVALVKSKEGDWVLFNDSQPVQKYKSLHAFLAEDKVRSVFLMNYEVTQPVEH